MGHCFSINTVCHTLRQVIKYDDVIKFQHLLSLDVDTDTPVDVTSGVTPLILATCYGSVKVLPFLLDSVSDADVCDFEGRSALDKAVLSYALATQFCGHRPAESKRRFFIFKLLVFHGCQKVNVKDLELCIRINENNSFFLYNFSSVIKMSPREPLQSVTLAIFIGLNLDTDYVLKLLLGGAGFWYVKRSWRSMRHWKRPMSTELMEVLIRATSDTAVLRRIVERFRLRGYGTTMSLKTVPQHLRALLVLAGCPKFLPTSESLDRSCPHKISPELHFPDVPHNLKQTCRLAIRRAAYPNMYCATQSLPLPESIKRYLMLYSS